MQSLIESIAKHYNLSEIYVFGSRASEIAARVRGDSLPSDHQESSADVDIGVQPARGAILSAKEKVRLTIALEDLFNVKRVDLVSLSEEDTFLALDIIRGELIYCNDPDEQAEHELYVLRRAGDLAFYERERRNMILSGGST